MSVSSSSVNWGLVVAMAVFALEACQSGVPSPPDALGSAREALRAGAPGGTCAGTPPPNCAPLDASTDAKDLIVKDCRIVGKGTYTFGKVNVVNGGTLWFDDQPGETSFYARSILVQQGGVVHAGSWCLPFGTNGGKLTIGLWGAASEDTSASIGCVDANGAAAPCYPADREGKYCVGGDPKDPCQATSAGAAGDNAYFEKYAVLHGAGMFGSKVLAVSYGGSLELFGKKGVADAARTDPEAPGAHPRACQVPSADKQFDPSAWAEGSGSSWVRLGGDANATASQIAVDRNVDWAPGDKVVLTTTDWYPSHSELLTLKGAAGSQLSTVEPLRFDHEGDVYKIDPTKLSHDPGHKNTTVDVRGAVGLLSRSIVIQSMGPSIGSGGKPIPFPEAKECGVDASKPDCYFGGHVMARQGFGRFQVQGVEFHQLGQGGSMGRYPVHFHLAKDTSYTNAFVTDSSIWESNTRFVTIHGTHGINIARNVGYLSVGHAFYLEDATEIENSFCYNLGVSARATFKEYYKAQPPESPAHRAIPPILDQVSPPARGQPLDWQVGIDASTPAMFWIMNADNDFVGNKAVGIHGQGVCYWPLNSSISGPSKALKWSGYANFNQTNHVAPLRRFRGNSCSTAAYAFMTERGSGFSPLDTLRSAGLDAILAPHVHPDDLPLVAGNFPATKRGYGNCVPYTNVPDGGKADYDACAVTILDHFTTSFNWAQVNVGSVWLRPYHYVFVNSAITDQLYGGLGFVSGGSPEQALLGQLALTQNSVFVGSTSRSGSGGSLGPDVSRAVCNGQFCTLPAEGVPYFVGDFQPKRLITIYDGPFFADGSIFDVVEKQGNPSPSSVYLRTVQPLAGGQMRVVDAGIGWKQSNGFYYPPVFAFRNSGFSAGSTRHNVVDQYTLYTYGNGEIPLPTGKKILGQPNFTPIDTTTILNDLDGTLNGLKPQAGAPRSSGLSNNAFYDAPHAVAECSSFGTNTVPYEFSSTFVAQLKGFPTSGASTTTDSSWANLKPAVAVYRQYRLPEPSGKSPSGTEACTGGDICSADGNAQTCRRGTFFMGSSIGQAIGLTVNNGLFYVDTATNLQNASGSCLGAQNVGYKMATFTGGKSYSIFHLFANSRTRVTYQVYVGPKFDPQNGFAWIRVLPHFTGGIEYETRASQDPGLPRVSAGSSGPVWFDKSSGILSVTVDQSLIKGSFALDKTDKLLCQPSDLCAPAPDGNGCVPVNPAPKGYEGLEAEIDTVCRTWVTRSYSEGKGGNDDGLFLGECPAGGCLGFAFTLPSSFQPTKYGSVGQALSTCYPRTEAWEQPMVTADSQSCPIPKGQYCTR